MTFSKLTPVLISGDVNRMVDFYRDVLGFTLVATVPDAGEFVFAQMTQGSVEMMFQTRGSIDDTLAPLKENRSGGSLTIYIDVDDVDALLASVRGKAEVVKELEATFYGTREFTIVDPSGFYLTFAGGGN
ncbi:MAG: hypothetical protein JWQ98_2766 [Chlorobi bacterium]|nr:hypothetical protein [Chlorobiota bacterium]